VKPPPFEYHAAASLEEAVTLLAEHGDEAKVLAGGQSLVPLLSLRLARPAHLVDVNRVDELATVEVDGSLRLGATVRHRTLERTAAIARANPLVHEAVSQIGHVAIRNRGTLGGSLAHGDPAAELPTCLVCLQGSVEATSRRGTRTIAADALFQGFFATALADDEVLRAVSLPALSPGTGWSFTEFSRRSGDFAIVGVAATLTLGPDGRVAAGRLAFCGAGPTPVDASAGLGVVGEAPNEALWHEAGRRAAGGLEPASDIHGSAEYRKHLAGVLAARALAKAAARAATAGDTKGAP
jgi:carbon-monoxide dehydrogenase medium subunit